MKLTWLYVVGLAGAAGCGGSGPVTLCTADLRGVMRLDIVDDATGAPTAAGATVRLFDLVSFNDTFTVPETVTSATAAYWFEDKVKAGSYRLTVTKPGYATWTQGGIHVMADACHVTTFDTFVARLTKS